MKQVKKILFPIDFTSHFENLLPWVKTMAGKFDATVYVLFVAQDLSNFSTFYVPHGNIESFQQQAVETEVSVNALVPRAAVDPIRVGRRHLPLLGLLDHGVAAAAYRDFFYQRVPPLLREQLLTGGSVL